MSECMTFPDTVEEFMEQYKVVDTEQVYTNGTEFVPIYRMRQWFQHEPERKKGKWIPMFDGKFCGGAYWFKCSECSRVVPDVRNGGWNFCPNCGSYNGGDDHDQSK